MLERKSGLDPGSPPASSEGPQDPGTSVCAAHRLRRNRPAQPVISGDNGHGTLPKPFSRSYTQNRHNLDQPPLPEFWRSDMHVRPQDLAARMSAAQPPQIFKLPIEEARCKAREILNQLPQGNFTPIVENWRQLPNGQIEFTMRHLRTADWRH